MLTKSMEKQYSVKEVMKICNVTRRELFYWEDRGLINAVRNSENNYRSYTQEEIFKVCFIKECRSADFEFDLIRMMLEDNSMPTLRLVLDRAMSTARKDLNDSYHKYIYRVERYNAMREASYIIDSDWNKRDIELVTIPDKYIVYHDFSGGFFDDILQYRIQYAQLDRIIQKYRFTKLSSRITCFMGHFDTEKGLIDEEAHPIRSFFQVAETTSDCPNFMLMGGTDALMIKHTGDYNEDLADTYYTLVQFAREKGYVLIGVSIEELLLDESFSYINRDNWATKIYMPIKRAKTC